MSDKCMWTIKIDDSDDYLYYETECKYAFQFSDGTRKILEGFNYCPYCGKEIEEVKE